MIEGGLNINSKNKEENTIFQSLYTSWISLENLKILIELKADLNSKNKRG